MLGYSAVSLSRGVSMKLGIILKTHGMTFCKIIPTSVDITDGTTKIEGIRFLVGLIGYQDYYIFSRASL